MEGAHGKSAAREKYDSLVRNAGLENLLVELSSYSEPYELSATEAEVFGIDPELWPALAWAYMRWESFIGVVDEYFEEFREEERTAFAEFFAGERIDDFFRSVGFMMTACDLPQDQCMGWVCKIYAANLRGGLYGGKDDQ